MASTTTSRSDIEPRRSQPVAATIPAHVITDRTMIGPQTMVGSDTVRVVIADDDFTVRAGIRSLLSTSKRLEVVAEARNADELTRVVAKTVPQVLVLDPSLDGSEGTVVLRELHQRFPDMRILVVSALTTGPHVRAAFDAGASGFVARDDDLADLPRIVADTHAGGTYVSQKISQALLYDYVHGNAATRDRDPLTERQRQILTLIAQGKSSRLVGEMLGITLRTVHTHRSRIMNKLDVHTEAGLVYAALRMGLVTVD